MRLRIAALLIVLGSLSNLLAVDFRKPAERKPAAAFELQDATGKPVRLSDYRGKIVILDFWATWCIPCRESIPWMNELSAKYKSKGVEILGVSMDDEGWKVVTPFLAELGMKYPTVIGTEKLVAAYGDVDALPSAFFLDRRHRIVATHTGGGTRAEFEAAIQTLLKSK